MDDVTPKKLTEALAARLKVASSTPADCSDEDLASVDFTRRDVLIGTVRSDVQFDFTLSSLSYYAPVKTIPPHDLPVRMVALYEEGLTRRAGIKRYGEVTEIRVVRRDEIPVPMSRSNGDEAYYLFTIRSWEYLDHPISIAGTSRGRPAFTSEFLLTHARRSYQLVCITSAAEYRLTQAVCRLYDQAITEQGKEHFSRISESHVISVAEGMLALIHARGEILLRCPLRTLETEPAEILRQISQAMGLRN
jgi:hypothetical protein